jgi:hypothetical protein
LKDKICFVSDIFIKKCICDEVGWGIYGFNDKGIEHEFHSSDGTVYGFVVRNYFAKWGGGLSVYALSFF